MDSEKDSHVQQFKWHFTVIGAALGFVVLLALFTRTFENTETLRNLVFLLGSLIFLGALLAMLSRVSGIVETLRDNSAKMAEATKALEDIRRDLVQINHCARISDSVKAIAFRDDDRQSLREAVFEKLKQKDFEGAYEIIDEIGVHSGYRALAAELRQQVDSYRNATEDERIDQAIEHIRMHFRNAHWAKASVQIEALIREHPASEKARAMRQQLVDSKEERKKILMAAWDDAVQQQETDRSLSILRELDMYLTPNEGLALQEAARDVFKTKLHNMGVQFAMAISDNAVGDGAGGGPADRSGLSQQPHGDGDPGQDRRTATERRATARLRIPLLLEIEERLCLDHRDLVGIGGEGVDVQFAAPRLEVHIAERLQPVHFEFRELHEDAAIAGEPLQIGVALPIEIGAHLFDLEIGHVADPATERTLVGARAAELEPLDQAAMREQLPRRADNLAQTHVAREDAHDMGAPGDPDQGLILLRLELPTGVKLEQLGVQRSLKKTERQLVNGDIGLWRFHHEKPQKRGHGFQRIVSKRPQPFKRNISTDRPLRAPYGTIVSQAHCAARLRMIWNFSPSCSKKNGTRRTLNGRRPGR
jgi:hypothetical protein